MAVAHSTHLQARQDRAIRYALNVLRSRLQEPGAALNSPREVRQYLAQRFQTDLGLELGGMHLPLLRFAHRFSSSMTRTA